MSRLKCFSISTFSTELSLLHIQNRDVDEGPDHILGTPLESCSYILKGSMPVRTTREWLQYETVGVRQYKTTGAKHKWPLTRQNLSSGFSTKPDTNQSPQLKRLARILEFRS